MPLGVLLHVREEPLLGEEMDFLSDLANLSPALIKVILGCKRDDLALDLANGIPLVLEIHVQSQVEELALCSVLVLSLLILEGNIVEE